MKFFIIFGPPAVGKMTVAKYLSELTNYPYFHNHLSIELALKFFEFGTPSFHIIDKTIRFTIFKEIAKSEYEGFIFTYAFAINQPYDHKYLEKIRKIFSNAEIYHIELYASLTERLRRNTLQDRLAEKPSKRDIEFSERLLLKHEEKYKFNSEEGELDLSNYLRIDNTNISALEAAKKIVRHFKLTR